MLNGDGGMLSVGGREAAVRLGARRQKRAAGIWAYYRLHDDAAMGAASFGKGFREWMPSWKGSFSEMDSDVPGFGFVRAARRSVDRGVFDCVPKIRINTDLNKS